MGNQMKILEPGIRGENWTIKHRCTGWGNGGKGCNALLQVDFDDLRYYPGVPGDSWGSRDPAVTFKCPCCSELTDLGLNDWPVNYRTLKQYRSGSEWRDEITVDNTSNAA
jgi:hypothetical protein